MCPEGYHVGVTTDVSTLRIEVGQGSEEKRNKKTGPKKQRSTFKERQKKGRQREELTTRTFSVTESLRVRRIEDLPSFTLHLLLETDPGLRVEMFWRVGSKVSRWSPSDTGVEIARTTQPPR